MQQVKGGFDPSLSLYHLLDPQVLANPYPLYHRLRAEAPVHWDPFLHAWVVTRYADVVTVFQKFSANRTPTPEQLTTPGLATLTPLAQVMVHQMLFVMLGGKAIRKRQAVIAVMGAANRDPERFVDPDQLDIGRQDNRHVAFAWASHFCFGAPLARLEGQIVFATLLRHVPMINLAPDPIVWRENLGLRGLKALPVSFLLSE